MTAEDVRPGWLRPGLLVVVIGVHACAALFLTLPRTEMPAGVDSIEITIAQGAPEVQPAPEPPPEVKPDPPPPEPPPDPPKEPPPEVPPPVVPPPPEPAPPVITAPAKRQVAEALPLPPRPKPKPPAPKPPVQTAPPPEPEAPELAEAQAQLAQARATYGSKVLAEIRNHRISTSGLGSVVVGFEVGPEGDMTTVTVVRSSGQSELDSAALRMVRASRPGPPPDGRFSGTTTINFVAK
jgi:protein TonB